MTPRTRISNPSKTRVKRLTAFSALLALLAMPTAAAADMSLPVLGEWDWLSIGGLAVMVLGAGLIALAGVKLFEKLPLIGRFFTKKNAGGVALVAFLVVGFANAGAWGSMFTGDAAPTASVTGAASATSVAWDATLYEATSDVTFYVADYEDKTTQNAAIKIFAAGVDEKKVVEGSATAYHSGTASSGTLTLSGIQVQTLGCTVDVHLDLSGYYEQIERNVNICVAKNPLGTNDISVPTFYIKDIGALATTDTDATLTCSAGSQCTFVIKVENTEDDAWVNDIAIKWTEGDADEDHTIDSVESGNCELVEVSSVKYVKFSDDLGPLASLACSVKITRATGDDDGSFNLTADDNFQYVGASAWNTNSNIRGASATAADETTFA